MGLRQLRRAGRSAAAAVRSPGVGLALEATTFDVGDVIRGELVHVAVVRAGDAAEAAAWTVVPMLVRLTCVARTDIEIYTQGGSERQGTVGRVGHEKRVLVDVAQMSNADGSFELTIPAGAPPSTCYEEKHTVHVVGSNSCIHASIAYTIGIDDGIDDGAQQRTILRVTRPLSRPTGGGAAATSGGAATSVDATRSVDVAVKRFGLACCSPGAVAVRATVHRADPTCYDVVTVEFSLRNESSARVTRASVRLCQRLTLAAELERHEAVSRISEVVSGPLDVGVFCESAQTVRIEVPWRASSRLMPSVVTPTLKVEHWIEVGAKTAGYTTSNPRLVIPIQLAPAAASPRDATDFANEMVTATPVAL
ncbi:hypothetical protein M885DRAFT_615214 [Pelagophyceae sp. CCMP2097]|nr:hypothetical protein M885DRAFT_615214 [Pelagophyceae sp. CCMP2097]